MNDIIRFACKEIKSETSSSVYTLLEHRDQNNNQNELFTVW